jgi:hypothetical protein
MHHHHSQMDKTANGFRCGEEVDLEVRVQTRGEAKRSPIKEVSNNQRQIKGQKKLQLQHEIHSVIKYP